MVTALARVIVRVPPCRVQAPVPKVRVPVLTVSPQARSAAKFTGMVGLRDAVKEEAILVPPLIVNVPVPKAVAPAM